MTRLLKSAGGWAACAAGVAVSLSVMAVAPSLAQSETPEKRTVRNCVNGPDTDTHVLNENTLLVMDRGRSAVLIEVAGCRLNPYDPLIFRYRGTTQICDPIDADISVSSPGGFQSPCFAQSVTPVSIEEGQRLSKLKFESNRK
ncbi:MAG: hypothetical protein QM645_12875 [Asticcacaulis sp.]